MNEAEKRLLKARETLSSEIVTHDEMIFHEIFTTVKLLHDEIAPKGHYKKENDKIEFTLEEFNKITKTLANLSSLDSLKNLSDITEEYYLIPRMHKLKILRLLNK
jgi:hypothetical protein